MTMKRLVLSIAIIALASSAATAAQGDQFNLRCKGTHSVNEIGADEVKPYEKVYRIDLSRKKWCEGECGETTPIASIQETQIVLTNYKSETRSMSSFVSERIDRITGEHDASIGMRSFGPSAFTSLKTWEGTCQREPFTGFPSPATKF